MAFRSEDDGDASLAVELNKGYNKTKNTKKEDNLLLLKSTLSIVSPDWETLDPNPDIQALFLEFNERFFYGKLLFCTLEWRKDMELRKLECAGTCEYLDRYSRAHIILSEQILKRRPRKDTVETLLHEMIHAYLYMTRGIFDGHGSEFLFHMDRINKETGANITVKHSFGDEVDEVMSDILCANGQNRDPSGETESILKHVELENNKEVSEKENVFNEVMDEVMSDIMCDNIGQNSEPSAETESILEKENNNTEVSGKDNVSDQVLDEVNEVMSDMMCANGQNSEASAEAESILKHVEVENNNIEVADKGKVSDQVIDELHKPCIACNAFINDDSEEVEVESEREIKVSRIRFLLFNGRTITQHFNPDSTLEEVYKIAKTLIPGTFAPSLSSRIPSLSLDTVPRDKTLGELGLVPSATIMVVPGTEHQEQHALENRLLSPTAVILGIFLACLLGFLYGSPIPQDYQEINLQDAENLAGSVWNFAYVLVSSVGCFIEGLGGLYYICGYIMIYYALRTMYVGLPHGRLVWVGGYDHN